MSEYSEPDYQASAWEQWDNHLRNLPDDEIELVHQYLVYMPHWELWVLDFSAELPDSHLLTG